MKNSKRKVSENRVELSAGWLSPSGEYFRLEGHHLCHEGLAQEILKDRKYRKKYYFDSAMTLLLDRKWAIIRDKTFNFPKKSYFVIGHSMRGYEKEIIEICKRQKKIHTS